MRSRLGVRFGHALNSGGVPVRSQLASKRTRGTGRPDSIHHA